METRTGNAESGDAGTSEVTDASGGAEAAAPETTNDSGATATAPDAKRESASEATSAPDRTETGEGTPPVAEPASEEVSGAADSDSDRDADRNSAPRVLSPTSKWRVLRTRVRAMSFVERVGKMAAHARPSKLQARAARADAMDRDSSETHQPATATPHRDLPDAPTATFTFTGALDVPDAELDCDIDRVLLRACLFHGGAFLGDVASVPATRVTNADGVDSWRFGVERIQKKQTVADLMASSSVLNSEEEDFFSAGDVYHLLARTDRKRIRATRSSTSSKEDDVELHVELNVVPARREKNDGDGESESEAWFGAPSASLIKKPRMVSERRPDEICVAWGRVPWPDEVVSGKKAEVDVPLRGGGAGGAHDASGSAPPDDPEGIALPASDKAKKQSASFFAKFTKKGKLLGRGPTISVRIAPPPPNHAAANAKLPREILCASRFVPLLAAFRDLYDREARILSKRDDTDTTDSGTGFPCSSNPALTTIPACLRDEHLADAFANAWRRARRKRSEKTSSRGDSDAPNAGSVPDVDTENVEILESLSLKFWSLLNTGALKDARVDTLKSGDLKQRRRRFGVIETSVAQHPHKALSRAPDLWNHEPFNVAEIRHVFQ